MGSDVLFGCVPSALFPANNHTPKKGLRTNGMKIRRERPVETRFVASERHPLYEEMA
jgi:hypothetical protein